MINCPFCGKLTDPKLENCPHCGGPMRAKIPQPAGRSAVMGTPHNCPNCSSAVQDGDIICVRCGTNLLTGQKIAEEQKAPPPARRNWWPVAAVLAGAVVIVAVVLGLLLLFGGNPLAEARTLSTQGEHLKAIAVLQEHVSDHPQDAEAYLLLGQVYWRAQQYPNAAQAFQQASTLDANNAEAALFEAVALNRTPNSERGDQVEALRRAVQSDPSNARARYLLALSQGLTHQYDAQIASLEESGATPGESSSAEMLGLARALNGQYEAAEQQLTEAAPSGDGDAEAALGFVAQRLGKTEEAVQHFQEALQQGTTIDMLVRTRLGMSYLSQGRYNEALPLLTDAKDHRDAAPEAPFYYALTLSGLGRTPEAIVELERIAAGTSELADEASTELVALHLDAGDVAMAEQALYRAQQAGQVSAKLYTLQGQIQAANGQLVEAQQSFRQAIQADPAYPAAHLEQGLLYVQREVMQDGIRELERYLELVPVETGDPRRNEIELLVDQLRQAVAG